MTGAADSIVINSALWAGIAFCITQSAIFSGLNLAFFGVSRLRLEIETSVGNQAAERVLALRSDSNFLLTTILWGNVGINVLLTLLSNSLMAGVTAFLFSTVLITFLGEIVPQAYFSRNALRMASLLSPLLRFYQFILYPVAKPVAKMLDLWLGREGIHYLKERELRQVIRAHVSAAETDIDRLEGIGALNFLALDDVLAAREGEPVDPQSIIQLPLYGDWPRFPAVTQSATDPFLQKVHASGRKWVVITDPSDTPCVVLDADAFLRDAFLNPGPVNPHHYCHRPIVISDRRTLLGEVVTRLQHYQHRQARDALQHDIVLVWEETEKRVITGADILERLLRGVTPSDPGLCSTD